MLQNNKGYTIVFVIVIMSIVVTIGLMSFNLINSNTKLISTSYEKTKIEEGINTGIEIFKSNLLYEVKSAMENSSSNQQYIDYFRGNDSYNTFIHKIKDINRDGIKNIDIKVKNSRINEENQQLKFSVIIESSEKIYSKKVEANVLIKLPETKVESEEVINIDENELKDLENKEIEHIVNEEIKDESIKEYILNELDLIKIYDIKEI